MKPLAAVSALLALASLVHADAIRAGAAHADITPPLGFPMWGYAVRHAEPSVKVRDPLQARAVVLAVGASKIALVSLDLGRPPTRQSMANIRAELKRSAQIETIFLVASHTHHGPVLELDDWPTKEKPYVRTLESQIVKTIITADKALQPARFGVGAHETAFNRNRHSKLPNPPLDKELVLLRLDDAQGKPIAHLVNFAAHPVMLPAKTREFSHDFPGFLAQHVEKELGGECLFLQGAAGDVSPNAHGEGPEVFGAALGKFVVEKSRALKCDQADARPIAARERDFKFASRIDIRDPFVYAAYSLAFFPRLIDFYEREYREGVRPHLTAAVLDGRIGFVGVSGEPFTSHSLQLKRRARLDALFMLGYCNDYQQYFPTIEAVAEGGYGADPTMSPAELGAGERIMDQALIDLFTLRGNTRMK